MPTLQERRRHQRYKTKENIFVAGNNQLGTVRDISLGGISFRYMHGSPNVSSMIDIFCVDRNFHLKEVSIRLVIDQIEVPTPAYASIPMRKSAGEFNRLTSQHQQELELFVNLLRPNTKKYYSASTT